MTRLYLGPTLILSGSLLEDLSQGASICPNLQNGGGERANFPRTALPLPRPPQEGRGGPISRGLPHGASIYPSISNGGGERPTYRGLPLAAHLDIRLAAHPPLCDAPHPHHDSQHHNTEPQRKIASANTTHKADPNNQSLVIGSHRFRKLIVFVNSKRKAEVVDDFLFNKILPCTSIHSDRTQREGEDAM
ncbi:uncharacterized protein BKA78DRAFT_300694 [Phyllosticta capitalensis]|uniref:uncharacterized protein n=1 Tax=Phyllosticta capitalensis TaxID=121624 RepID=UPI00312D185D